MRKTRKAEYKNEEKDEKAGELSSAQRLKPRNPSNEKLLFPFYPSKTPTR
jgi:hypothetical protein